MFPRTALIFIAWKHFDIPKKKVLENMCTVGTYYKISLKNLIMTDIFIPEQIEKALSHLSTKKDTC